MRSFDEIYQIAAERHGGAEALRAKIGSLADPTGLTNDRVLSELSKNVFRAGFNWKVIEAKWAGFEDAFHGFDVGRCAMMDDAWFDALVQDTRIVRHGAKIQSVRDNAAMLQELAAEHGKPAAEVIANWPREDFIGLLQVLKTRGTRLGGNTGAYALRFMKVDGFILSRDVVARLVAEGVVDKAPTSKGAMRKAQDAFNAWSQESGRSLTEISRVLALSIG
ncbi:DNA-3-methyladenine glycosylase [Candidatus Rhodobacter oscarellae]|uniref:DNA-3-methyladenine glycosylase n=1 Tax=Candidatus Rhodobacter oscarellae TaxID=1675527 RepID=A0A0J9E236_9RHOB|nr:DNA-3-methyladenine glycosylase I [Candidatus Rhodobacter lobularis]KMW56790.1 DNA-3-methyladenine glycosylase [Candidatus Rhodobacter lobularis]